MSSILDRDSAEAFKGSVHAASLALVAVMFAYNAAAFHARGKTDRHLLLNAFVYGLVAGFEVYQTARHWQSGTERSRAVGQAGRDAHAVRYRPERERPELLRAVP